MTAKGELPDYEIKKLNMLSFPTDVIPKCELTGVNANYQLSCPDVTLYYASEQLAGDSFSYLFLCYQCSVLMAFHVTNAHIYIYIYIYIHFRS